MLFCSGHQSLAVPIYLPPAIELCQNFLVRRHLQSDVNAFHFRSQIQGRLKYLVIENGKFSYDCRIGKRFLFISGLRCRRFASYRLFFDITRVDDKRICVLTRFIKQIHVRESSFRSVIDYQPFVFDFGII